MSKHKKKKRNSRVLKVERKKGMMIKRKSEYSFLKNYQS
jgi:hypothetical protein